MMEIWDSLRVQLIKKLALENLLNSRVKFVCIERRSDCVVVVVSAGWLVAT